MDVFSFNTWSQPLASYDVDFVRWGQTSNSLIVAAGEKNSWSEISRYMSHVKGILQHFYEMHLFAFILRVRWKRAVTINRLVDRYGKIIVNWVVFLRRKLPNCGFYISVHVCVCWVSIWWLYYREQIRHEGRDANKRSADGFKLCF